MKGKKTKGREQAAACQRSRLHGVLHGENGRKCSPPNLHPPTTSPNSASAPATLYCVSQESQTLQLALLNRERQRDRKKDGERKRGHTTGRHQLKPCSLSLFFFFRQFFPFISHFMIEFLTNTLAVHWVQTHSKNLLFDSTSLRML